MEDITGSAGLIQKAVYGTFWERYCKDESR